MEQSENIKELTEALSAAQGEMPAAPFNSVNPFLKNRFADLGSIVATAQPVLAKHGLSVSQFPVSEDGKVGVITQLMHSSGEWMRSMISLPSGEEKGKSMAQVAGSVITYLRRYSYAAVLGMYAEEDADGSMPSKKAIAKSPGPVAAEPPKPESKKALPTESVADAKAMWDGFLAEYGITAKAALKALGTKTVGAWITANSGKGIDDAIIEVEAVMGLKEDQIVLHDGHSHSMGTQSQVPF